MQSKAATVEEYLAELPKERRQAISLVREVILKNLDKNYVEGMSYGMIGYCVPHSVFPPGYHCDPKQALPFVCLASQKNYMSLYMMCVYGDSDHARWFQEAWAKTGKKLDMGKSCIRFKKVEDLPLEVIGDAIKRMPAKKFIAYYESVMNSIRARPSKGPNKKTSATPKKARTSSAKQAVKKTAKPAKKAAKVKKKSVKRASRS